MAIGTATGSYDVTAPSSTADGTATGTYDVTIPASTADGTATGTYDVTVSTSTASGTASGTYSVTIPATGRSGTVSGSYDVTPPVAGYYLIVDGVTVRPYVYLLQDSVLYDLADSFTPPVTSSMPGALPGFTPVFAEDFLTAAAIGSFQSVYGADTTGYPDGFVDTQTNQTPARRGFYYPSKVLSAIEGVTGTTGIMDYYVHSEVLNGTRAFLVANSTPGPSQAGGRWSWRMRADTIAGYKIANLLWPTSETWAEGELDFPEGSLGGPWFINHHSMTPGSESDMPYSFGLGTIGDVWHTYTLEWLPGVAVRYYVDDVRVLTATRDIPTTAHDLRLQVETNIGGADPSTTVSGHVQYDWITVHALVNGYDYSTIENYPMTATDGTLPAPLTSVRGTNVVTSNRLVSTSPTTQWSSSLARLNTYVTDGKFRATVRLVNSSTYAYLGFRYDVAGDRGYVIAASVEGLKVQRWNNGNATTFGSAAFTFTVGVDYVLEVIASAGGMTVRAWAASGSRPATAQIVADFGTGVGVDYSYIQGDVVCMAQTSTAGTAGVVQFDDIKISDLPNAY